jgi:hypothetical protein
VEEEEYVQTFPYKNIDGTLMNVLQLQYMVQSASKLTRGLKQSS